MNCEGRKITTMVNLIRDFYRDTIVGNDAKWGPCQTQGGAFRVLSKYSIGGFTAIEIILVVVIIAIAAVAVVPMFSSAADMQIRSAANMVAADLEYAKSMAISRQKIYAVVFNESTESYQIEDPNGIITHPVKKGPYVVDFSRESRLNKVDIADVDFDPYSSHTITFDYLGSPYSGSGTSNPLNSGTVNLQAGSAAMTINVEPITGYVNIQ